MPQLSRNFVRLSLAYLATGFTLGALLLINKGIQISPLTWRLLPIHAEVLLMGWFIQLALGVSYWILPRLAGDEPRGSVRLAWSAFWLINLGITLVILGSLIASPSLSLAGRLAELLGVVAFVACSWRRVKPFAG
jgi:heme/copper-type cytochrome/quinol oxidase subunit 1